MLEEIRQIQNPLIRSATAASAAFVVATIVSGAAVGLVNAKDKATYGVYASLIGTGCGAIAGLASGKKVTETESKGHTSRQSTMQSIADSKTWQDWRNFVVIRKVNESEEITSFYLKPEDNGEIPTFQPGQFLTIKLNIPDQAKPVIRTYSLSDYPESCDYYRLSIKREPAPKGLEVPPGVASNFMHDQVQEGSVIPAKPPSGKFVLNVENSIPAVLISNGVGITPMISMAKACSRLSPHRPIWFLHGAREGRYHAFRDEVIEIAQQNANLHLHFAYSRPSPEDEGLYHSMGYVDTALVRSLVEQDAEFFLCGSPPFLRSLMEGLKEWGVPEDRVFFESFGQPMKAMPEKPPAAPVSAVGGAEAEITFAESSKTLTWRESDGSILEFAEANDLNPDYSCRQGICGTCMCKIREGEVEYLESPTAAIAEGSVLICISKPKTSRVVLDL
jgi:ferredoxin-NADP reductase